MIQIRFWVLWAVVGVVYSVENTVISTAPLPTTTEAMIACMCLGCENNNAFFTKHTQNFICDSEAVILGRVTSRRLHSDSQGLWNSHKHKEQYPERYFGESHHELNVRILDVYSNRGPVKVKVGDKINIRYARLRDCHHCETLAEDFNDETYVDRALKQADKYVFFLPILQDGFGDRKEAVIRQCDKVWRYKKRGVKTPGEIPLLQRYLLTATNCDKCRVSGCFQNKCVKADEFEECDRQIWHHEWEQNSCRPLMDHGLCYYNVKADSCKWTSVTEDGYRSRKVIEECLNQ